MDVKGNAGFVFHTKLKNLKGKIQQWVKANLGKVEDKINTLEGLILGFDLEEETRLLDEDEAQKRHKAIQDLRSSLKSQELLWSRKARTEWKQGGDQCSRFFHQLVNSSVANKNLESLSINGSVTPDKTLIQQHLKSFYTGLYCESESWRPVPNGLDYNKLEPAVSSNLECAFSELEVWQAIDDLDSDNSPGPDGFTMRFYKCCWGFIKNDLLRVFDNFYRSGFLDWRANTTHIALIPKVPGASLVVDFRPISLLSGCYKIISKVLANRLKPHLHSLVSDLQGASIVGRQIQDLSLMANELLDSRLLSKKGGVLVKVDFYKAFDSVSWNFIDFILDKFGFGQKWRQWFRTCWSTASFSVLLNGSPGDMFKSSRGLRQGDPLSPMVFVLVAEVLTLMMLKVQEAGLLEGFKVSEAGVGIPILQFADDTLLLTNGGMDEARLVKNILIWFEACSGLRVNASKTKIYQVNKVERWNEIVDFWKSNVGSFPDTYLGLPLGAKYKCVSVWDPLLERFRQRLALWKRRYLSKGGRMVLISSTLLNLPVYMFSSRLVPVTVVEELEKIVRRFFWGSKEGKRKIHLVSYEGICLPRELGGLGFKRVREINLSLLCKWFWRLKEDRLWVRLLKEKYGTDVGGFFPKMSRLPFGISVWRGLSHALPIFKSISRWKVGNGSCVSFWHDRWCSPFPLARLFPGIYAVASTKNLSVSEVYSLEGPGHHGSCLGTAQGCNEQMADLLVELKRCYMKITLSDEVDELLWSSSSDSMSVANCYSNLLSFRLNFFSPGVMQYRWNKIWIQQLPSKVSFLLWLLIRDRVLTHNNLQRRGFSLVSQCLFCKQSAEDVDHLFSQCFFTSQVWDYFSGSQHGDCCPSFRERVSKWNSFGLTRHGQLMRKFLPHAISWCLWRERNQRCFDERENSLQQIICSIKETIWGWYMDSEKKNTVRLERVIFDWQNL